MIRALMVIVLASQAFVVLTVVDITQESPRVTAKATIAALPLIYSRIQRLPVNTPINSYKMWLP